MQPDEIRVTCDALAELQVRRKYCIGLANKITNAAGALVRRMGGFDAGETEEAREKVRVRAARIVKAAMEGEAQREDDAEIAEVIAADLAVTLAALQPLEARRHEIELQMRRLVRTLPVWQWAKPVRGLGEIGLAVIIGEAGELSRYANVGKLWKRLGLAPFGGKAASTWRRDGGLSADEWTALGYSPGRRAEIFSCVGDPLFRQQTMVIGPYRVVYDMRRADTEVAHPDWTKLHSHRDALRIMTKALIADLWSAWREANDRLMPNGSVLPAEPIADAA